MNATQPSQQASQPEEIRIALPTNIPFVMYGILGFTICVYLLQWISVLIFGYAVYDLDWLQVLGGRVNEYIRAGQIWRFITPIFLHLSLAHILFNMYALVSVGSFLEQQLGHARFFLVYFISGFAGNVFSFLLTQADLSVGASGAIFGLIATDAVFFYQNRRLFGAQAKKALGNIAFIITINTVIGVSLGFDNYGHLGGFLGGAVFTWFAGPKWKIVGAPPLLSLADQRSARDVLLGGGIALAIFGMLAIGGMIF